jgi:hypothetical protein
MRSDRQPVATYGNGVRLFRPELGLSDSLPIATRCDRSPP